MMDTPMNAEHNNVAFPTEKTLAALRERIAVINGPESFAPARQWQSEAWHAQAHCSRGPLLEKAGIGMLHLAGETVEGAPAQITMLQAMAYPAHPRLPGLIVMASTSQLDGQDAIMMLYADLILQGGKCISPRKSPLRGLSGRYASGTARVSMTASCTCAAATCWAAAPPNAAYCIFLKNKDSALLEELVAGSLESYSAILAGAAIPAPEPRDRQAMQEARRRVVDWILTQDYGVKVARENSIPLEFMECYGFPPLQN